jgi:hypothetical protein
MCVAMTITTNAGRTMTRGELEAERTMILQSADIIKKAKAAWATGNTSLAVNHLLCLKSVDGMRHLWYVACCEHVMCAETPGGNGVEQTINFATKLGE